MRHKIAHLLFRLFLLLIIAACVVGIFVFKKQEDDEIAGYDNTIREYTSQTTDKDDTTKKELNQTTGTSEPHTPETQPAEEAEVQPAPYTIGADFPALREVNGDVIGWISIPDTIINYPLVQGNNNSYYLYHNWDKKSNSSGTVFMDARSNLETDDILYLYGHSGVSQGRAFSSLLKYKTAEYLQEHPYVYISFADDPIGRKQTIDGVEQPEGQYQFQIYAVFNADSSDEKQLEKFFLGSQETDKYVANASISSLFDIELDGTPAKCVTLSTCSYPGQHSDVKFLVCAALLEETLAPAE